MRVLLVWARQLADLVMVQASPNNGVKEAAAMLPWVWQCSNRAGPLPGSPTLSYAPMLACAACCSALPTPCCHTLEDIA